MPPAPDTSKYNHQSCATTSNIPALSASRLAALLKTKVFPPAIFWTKAFLNDGFRRNNGE
jgi:hypothetical protein